MRDEDLIIYRNIYREKPLRLGGTSRTSRASERDKEIRLRWKTAELLAKRRKISVRDLLHPRAYRAYVDGGGTGGL